MGWLWRLGVLVAWLVGLLVLLRIGDSGYAYVFGGALLTVAVGALVDRWWVLLAPALVTLVLIGLILATDPDCSSCAYEGSRYFALWLPTLLFGIPGVVAMAVGVGARRLVRRMRRAEPAG
jgi:hypothetical protein